MSRSAGHRDARLTWLPAVLPADASHFRVGDRVLEAALADAGGDVRGEAPPDVEISLDADAEGEAPLLAFAIGDPARDAGLRAGQVAGRVARALSARGAAALADRRLARLGYEDRRTTWWDIAHPIEVSADRGVRHKRPLVEHLPQRAVVVGRRGEPRPTVLDAAAADAARASGGVVAGGPTSAREGLLMQVRDGGVLRLTVGPARASLDDQADVLTRLAGPDVDVTVGARVPRLLGRGRTGVGDWSLEQRMEGRGPETLDDALIDQCVEFLVALPRSDAPAGAGVRRDGDELAAAVSPDAARYLDKLIRRVEAHAAELPPVLEHGDFFIGNLLVAQGTLSAVVDWDAARSAGLPLLDLIHLRYTAQLAPTDVSWGPMIAAALLPWARGGADPVAVEYARRLGFDATRATLETAVVAYWLGRAAFQLRAYEDRARRPAWVRRNVTEVLAALRNAGV